MVKEELVLIALTWFSFVTRLTLRVPQGLLYLLERRTVTLEGAILNILTMRRLS